MFDFIPSTVWERLPEGIIFLVVVLVWIFNNNKFNNAMSKVMATMTDKFLDAMNTRDDKTSDRFERLFDKAEKGQEQARKEHLEALRDTTQVLTKALADVGTRLGDRIESIKITQDNILSRLDGDEKLRKLEMRIDEMGESKSNSVVKKKTFR